MYLFMNFYKCVFLCLCVCRCVRFSVLVHACTSNTDKFCTYMELCGGLVAFCASLSGCVLANASEPRPILIASGSSLSG